MMTFTLAEKVATVAKARASGNFGQYLNLKFGRAKVTVEGRVFLISQDAHGWLVGMVGTRFVGADPDLELAAQMAIEAGA